MKFIYLSIATLLGFSTYGQYTIDFDDMNLGPVSPQSQYINIWPTAGDCNVVDLFASSGTQSMQVRNNSFDDVVFLLGNRTSGTWVVKFNMYVTANSSAYWNIQESETPGVQWNGEFIIGQTAFGGMNGMVTYTTNGQAIAIPYDQWFEVRHEVNLATKKLSVSIDGNVFLNEVDYQGDQGLLANSLGSINFFSIDNNCNYFIDDFDFAAGSTASLTPSQATVLKAYPNPVHDVFTLTSPEKMDKIEVYSALGELVFTASPGSSKTQLNLAHLKTGLYLVKVHAQGQTQTLRVVKK